MDNQSFSTDIDQAILILESKKALGYKSVDIKVYAVDFPEIKVEALIIQYLIDYDKKIKRHILYALPGTVVMASILSFIFRLIADYYAK